MNRKLQQRYDEDWEMLRKESLMQAKDNCYNFKVFYWALRGLGYVEVSELFYRTRLERIKQMEVK